MNKLVRDGRVAVLISPGHGAGWSTWNSESEEILFDPAIVEFVEHNKWKELEVYATLRYPDIYLGGMRDLQIEWLPEGTEFVIEEYDGAETLRYRDEVVWHRA